jgi:hypothetical protein
MIMVIEVPLARAELKPAKIKPTSFAQSGKICQHSKSSGQAIPRRTFIDPKDPKTQT